MWVPMRVGFFAWKATWEMILILDHLKRTELSLGNRCFMCKKSVGIHGPHASSLQITRFCGD